MLAVKSRRIRSGNTKQMTIRVDADLKQQAEALCSEMGLTMSAALNVFLKALVRQRAFPFSIEADPFYNEKNIHHLKAAIDRLNAGKGQEHELVDLTHD